MPPPASQPQRVVLIDKEWASTHVSLPMQVPNSWWKGYKKDDKTMNARTIVGAILTLLDQTTFNSSALARSTPCDMTPSTSTRMSIMSTTKSSPFLLMPSLIQQARMM